MTMATEIDIPSSLLDHIPLESELAGSVDDLEILSELIDQPLDINTATQEQWQQLPWISEQLASRLVCSRKRDGLYTSRSDLTKRGLISEGLAGHIAPFIRIEQKGFRDISIQTRHRLYRRLEKGRGYSEHIYSGSPWSCYNRIRIRIGRSLESGWLAEKDAGESSLTDHLTGYFRWHHTAWHSTVLLGHFSVESGYGLIFWRPFGMGLPTGASMRLRNRGRGCRSYLSTNEHRALQGVAYQFENRSLRITLFTSKRKQDAKVERDSLVSLDEAGYHRTPAERSKKHRIREQCHGANLEVAINERVRLGATWHRTDLSHPWASQDALYKRIRPWKTGQTLWEGFVDYRHKTLALFITRACHRPAESAWLAGGAVNISSLRWLFYYRYYSPGFTSPHGHALGQRHQHINNEQGAFIGCRYHPSSQLTLSVSMDLYRHDWPRFSHPLPTAGQSWQVFFRYRFENQSLLSVQIERETTENGQRESDGFGNPVYRSRDQNHLRYRLLLENHPHDHWILKTRLEGQHIDNRLQEGSSRDAGLLITQQAVYTVSTTLKIRAGISFFDTRFGETRWCPYEIDLPGRLSFKQLTGRGYRSFATLSWRPLPALRLSAKWGQTRYDDRDTIGSGYSAIKTPIEHHLGLQLDVRF